MINCLFITIIWVLILDQLQFWNDFSTIISGWLSGGKIKKSLDWKPFNCSVCMSFWTNLIYIFVTNQFSILMILYILVLSWTTPIFSSILTLVKNLFLKFINTIANKFDI
jgi:hypothetical protein